MNDGVSFAGNVGVQVAKKLQGDVFKGKSRSMEKLKYLQLVIQSANRCYFFVTERCIAVVNEFLQILARNFSIDI
ncbi:hypothetical protein D3C80_1368040 [compost metagenome]